MILVTGGTGLVGAHLLVELSKTEATVKAICRPNSDLKKVEKVFSYYFDNHEEHYQKINWIIADINDIPALEIAFEGVTYVYHCAALISFNPKDYDLLHKINCEGTANIINISLAKNIEKLCYISSIAALGKDTKTTEIDEESDWNNKDANVYALTKYDAELEVWRGSQEGLSVILLNPGIILGPGFWNTGSGTLFKNAAKERSYFPPGGTGFIAVHDVVQLMLLAMNSNINKERFITIAKNSTYKEILTTICQEMGIKTPTKELKFWQLEILWRADWLRDLLFKKGRSITQNTVQSLRANKEYNNQKIINAFEYTFEPIEKTIEFCAAKYAEENT
tara:strand:- start:1472 stop:2479 length:1008 start_codon:yes stop_codon:yes gene_type:complete